MVLTLFFYRQYYWLHGLLCSDRTITDPYVQPVQDQVDILWVVDNSASMFEEQDQLVLHADSFIGYLSMAPVDFKLGITSTDMDVEVPGAL